VFVTRRRRGEDRHLGWKVRILAVGSVMALMGIRSGRSWMVWVAAAVLAVGLLLNLVRGRRPPEEGDPRSD